jgi:hypothetical protein
MTLPSFLFGLLVSLFYGSLFHLILDGGLGRLIVFIIFSIIGFWAGHITGALLGFHFLAVGPLNLGTATLFCWVFMGIGYWLSLVRKSSN